MTKRTADLLRMRLAELQWTQQGLADHAGVSQSHMSQILAGNKHIYLDQLARMCESMGISLREVVGEAESARDPLSARDALMEELNEIEPPYRRPLKDRTVKSESDAG